MEARRLGVKCLFPPFGFILILLQVDVKKTALALAITDSELSDEEASILESGGFSVSRATTPQLTDVSEGMNSLFPLLVFLFTDSELLLLCSQSSKNASSS